MKSKAFKLTIGVCLIILAALIVVGFKECTKNMGVKNQTSPSDEVVVITDKTEYTQGEEIKASLSYKATIYAWGRYAWSIQKWDNGAWLTILRRGDPFFLCSNIPECKDGDFSKIEECPPLVLCEKPSWSQVQGTPKLSWDQSYKVEEKAFQCKFIQRLPDGRVTSEEVVNRTCVVFRQAPPGKYRIRFEYTLAPDPSDPFSRDIDIKYAEREITIREH
jgi:hypothetical protein